MDTHPYRKLLIMGMLSFVSMYVLMYAMVNSYDDVFHNINQVYMAGLMTAPMVMIELALMRHMYKHRGYNLVSAGIAVFLLGACFAAIRNQAAVSDTQFLRSMIPHHGAAILMCEQARLRDPQVLDLCKRIESSQQAEIDEMKAKLNDLSR
jgi:uncharacterized protein (DUF305 family)